MENGETESGGWILDEWMALAHFSFPRVSKYHGYAVCRGGKKTKNHFGFLVLLIKTTMTDGFIQLKPCFFANSTCDKMKTLLSIFLKNHAPFSGFLCKH
jgi:hypothetical protein